MKTRYLFTVLLLALALPATAEFRTIQRAYEVGSTRWILNGESMPLADFRARIARFEDEDRKSVTVLHHLEDDRVTAVTVTVR
jgi:hypothetical protein